MGRLLAMVVLAILAGSCTAQLTGNYNIVVEENGNALVTLVITGLGTINVPLPVDVSSPAVMDALYVKEKNGVEVSVDAGGKSTIVYKSALLTSRQGADWRFGMDLPGFDATTVVAYVPRNVQVTRTAPNAPISHIGASKSIIWNLNSSDRQVEAWYRYTSGQADDDVAEDAGESSILNAAVVVGAAAAATLALLLLIRKKPGKVVISQGKQNVMKTMTGNETKIVSLLLQEQGGMQRNVLEKTSGIPKSSLASTLYNLEQRNVISVDKSYAVHYVELTEWFKSL